MPFHWVTDWAEFKPRAIAFLRQNPSKNNLHWGLLEARPELTENTLPFWVDDGETTQLVGEINPFNLVLSGSAAAAPQVAAALLAKPAFFTGLAAEASLAATFRDAWSSLTGAAPTHAVPQFFYECTPEGLIWPAVPPSQTMVVATPAHRDILCRWIPEFVYEAMSTERAALPLMLAGIDSGIAGGRYHLWVDGETVVSLAGLTGRTPAAARIGPVYTPPEGRGHGYASALTAALTQKIFELGHTSAVLYTDANNPTSNRIYQQIGYRIIGESLQLSYAPRR